MNVAKQTLRRSIAVLACATFVWAAPVAFAKAYFATEEEMIERAEVIAIVDISLVERAETNSQPFTYSEVAHATVHQTIKGTLPRTVDLYGGESFICAQVHFAPGRYLVFLCHDHELLVGCNWYLSVRPIRDTQIEWYVPDELHKLSWQPLALVLQRIQNFPAKPKDG
jgi:hypothetical protein